MLSPSAFPKIFLGFRVNQLKVDITELADELEALKKDIHRESGAWITVKPHHSLAKDITSLTADREKATKLRKDEKVQDLEAKAWEMQ